MYKDIVNRIVSRYGGLREKAIMANPHTIEKSETWNEHHKVLNVLENHTDPDGYRSGFAVDIVTMSIVG